VNREPEERYRAARHLSLYLTIPLLLAVAPLIGLFLGMFLDRVFNTGPILMIVFLGLGFVAGGREVYRILARISREEEEAREAKREAEREGGPPPEGGPGGA
jgi:ATP synthase protein I